MEIKLAHSLFGPVIITSAFPVLCICDVHFFKMWIWLLYQQLSNAIQNAFNNGHHSTLAFSSSPLVPHMDQHYNAYSAPNHYLNQCWVIVNYTLRNKLLWNFNLNTKFFIYENAPEIIACKMVAILSRPHFYQTRSAWSVDQGSNKNHSPAYNFAPTVTKFCVMWEGLSLPHDTKFGNCRCKIVDSRSFPSWSLIHGLRWSGLIKVGPGGDELKWTVAH